MNALNATEIGTPDKPAQPGRRRFLLIGGSLLGVAAATGGLVVACSAPSARSRLGSAQGFPVQGQEVALNGWVKITPDDRVIVALPRAEMGQGVHTALAMLVAEELDADWARVSTEAAPLARIYANTALLTNMLPFQPDDDGTLARMARASMQRLGYALSLQVTGGSSSVRDAWEPLRLAGAAARHQLVQAAAQRWQVAAAECRVAQGVVSHAGSGRSARFGELVAEAARLELPADLALKPAADHRLIGKPVPRLDVPAKTNGSALFGIDVRLPGLLHAAIAQCPVFGGKLAAINNAAEVKALRGVKDVFALGEASVVVLADNTWRARQALAALNIRWDEGPHAGLNSDAISTQLQQALSGSSSSGFRDDGNAEQALAGAARKLEAIYSAPFLAHATMEPQNCTAQFKDGQLSVWTGTQSASLVRWRAAKVAGIDEAQVTLHPLLLGGGFGRRLEFDMVEQAVAIALRSGGAPVKLTWSREEDMQHDFYRPAARSHFSAGLDAQGRPVAWLNQVAAPSIALATTQRVMPAIAMDSPDKNQIEGAFDLPYAIANLRVRQMRVATPVPVGSWRSVGHSYNAFFTESFVDELAHAARRDPLEFRLSLLAAHPRHRAVLELAASRAGWGDTKSLPAGQARGLALHESFGSICAQVVEVSVPAVDGKRVPIRVHRVVCALDCGSVVNPDTVDAQLQSAIVFGLSAALAGEITLEAGRVQQSNFHNYPVLGLANMPQIETHIIPSTATPGGVGEPGTPPIAPAVANAVFALTGQRLRNLPLRLEA